MMSDDRPYIVVTRERNPYPPKISPYVSRKYGHAVILAVLAREAALKASDLAHNRLRYRCYFSLQLFFN